MLKYIYFPYIQNDDGFDEFVRTSAPVEFEVNGIDLTEVVGGEIVATDFASYKWSIIYSGAHLRKVLILF